MNVYFSIVIAAFNAEKTLAKTLDSVLAQTCTDYELIFIDDASTDSTSAIIEEYKAKFSHITIHKNKKNIGVANSRNFAISIAKGTYIALLDSDDTWHTEKLQIQKDCTTSTGCDICCTSYSFVNEQYKPIKRPYIVPCTINYETMLKENHIGCSTVIIKKDMLKDTNYDTAFYHEDYALWLQLIRKGAKICSNKDVLMYYRISSSARSYNKLNSALHRYKIYRMQEKMSLIKSMYYFIIYAINGLRKHVL